MVKKGTYPPKKKKKCKLTENDNVSYTLSIVHIKMDVISI